VSSVLDELWTCPECGRKLVTRNIYHSCTDATVDAFLERASPHTRALYARFEAMIAACGPYLVSPARTRIAFMAKVRFASVSRVDATSMTCGFSLPYRLATARIRRVEEIVPGWVSHSLVVTRLEELDDELQGWLAESYRLMGMRERLQERPRGARPRAGARRASAKPR
jgi:hypothetical protein